MTLQLADGNKVNSQKIAGLAAPSDRRQLRAGLLYFLLRKACGDWEFDSLQNDRLNFQEHFPGSFVLPAGEWGGQARI